MRLTARARRGHSEDLLLGPVVPGPSGQRQLSGQDEVAGCFLEQMDGAAPSCGRMRSLLRPAIASPSRARCAFPRALCASVSRRTC